MLHGPCNKLYVFLSATRTTKYGAARFTTFLINIINIFFKTNLWSLTLHVDLTFELLSHNARGHFAQVELQMTSQLFVVTSSGQQDQAIGSNKM